MLPPVPRLRPCLLATLWLAACSPETGPKPDTDAGKSAANPPQAPASGPADPSLGQLVASDTIDLTKIVHKSPAEVDAVLGAPTDTGTDRISCVRFVPERVFFACEQEIRVYGHPKFESIRVEFEDGYAAVVALAGLPGEGEFEPEAALASVGLSLPESPAHDNPALNQGTGQVDRWEWGNSRARLRVDGLEHRVRLTVVDGDWRRAKLELIENNPLSPEQQARVKAPRGGEGAAPAPSETPAETPAG